MHDCSSFGGHQSRALSVYGDFPYYLSALPSNSQFIIKLLKMWPGGTPHVVVGTLKIDLKKTTKNKNTRSLVECCRVSSCE